MRKIIILWLQTIEQNDNFAREKRSLEFIFPDVQIWKDGFFMIWFNYIDVVGIKNYFKLIASPRRIEAWRIIDHNCVGIWNKTFLTVMEERAFFGKASTICREELED